VHLLFAVRARLRWQNIDEFGRTHAFEGQAPVPGQGKSDRQRFRFDSMGAAGRPQSRRGARLSRPGQQVVYLAAAW
jgi:hypothetical protein